MTKPTADTRITAYLAELGRLLAAAGPAERAEIVEGVRAHIAAELDPDPSSENVTQVLVALGTPGQVAAAWITPASVGLKDPRPLSGDWVIPVILILQALGLGVPIFYVPVIAVLAAIVLCWISPRYTRCEKILNTLAAAAAPIGATMLLSHAINSMDGCYDPTIEAQPFSSMPTCEELNGTGAMVFTGSALLIIALAALTALVIAYRIYRRRAARWDLP